MRRTVVIRFACDIAAFMRGCQDLCRIYTQRIRTAIPKDLKPFSERDAGNLMPEAVGAKPHLPVNGRCDGTADVQQEL